jgi:DNA-binding beta-propeller fold protein YncE
MRVLHRVLLPICALAACHVGDPPEREPPPSWVLAGEEGPLAEPAVESCARRSPGVGPRPLASAGASSSSASSVALARAGEHLVAYVADEDERALRVVDIDERRELSQVTLEGRPSSVLIAPDGRIVVTLRDRARVEVLEPAADGAAPPALRCAIDVPSEPVGMAATPDGASLLLVSRWGHALQVFDFHSFELKRTVELPRDPQAVLSSADGKQALIAHVAGSTISVVDLGGDAALPRLISTHVTEHSARRIHHMPMAPTSDVPDEPPFTVHRHERFGTQGFALARLASGKLLLPQVMVETGSGTGVAGGYGDSSSFPTVVGEVSVVLPDEQRIQVTPVNRDGGSPCLLPRATAVDEVGGELLVACMGHDAVIAYGTKASLPRRDERRRWAVGAGPTGIAVDEGSRRAVVHSAFASSLEVLALGKPRAPGEPRVDLSRPLAGTRIPLARRAPLDPTLALGRSLFHGAGGMPPRRRRARLRELPPRRPRRRAHLVDAGWSSPDTDVARSLARHGPLWMGRRSPRSSEPLFAHHRAARRRGHHRGRALRALRLRAEPRAASRGRADTSARGAPAAWLRALPRRGGGLLGLPPRRRSHHRRRSSRRAQRRAR